MATECKSVARTLPPGTDVRITIRRRQDSSRKLRITCDYDGEIVESVMFAACKGIDDTAVDSQQ